MPVGDAEAEAADPAPRSRRRRLRSAEVRKKMLDTARDMALDGGVGISLEYLSLEEIIQRARVPRSSVYRLWPFKDQFATDVLSHMAGQRSWFADGDVFDPKTFDLVRKTIDDHSDLLRTAAGRRAVLCEAVRQAVARNVQAFCENLNARIHLTLVGAVGTARNTIDRARIAADLDEAETASRRAVVALFRDIMPRLGLRLRDQARTLEHLVTAGSVLVQGMAMRQILSEIAARASGEPGEEEAGAGRPAEPGSEALLTEPLPGPGLDGRPAEWSLAATAYLGLVDSFTEPDPDFRPEGYGTPPEPGR